jgi:hypothetical protein
VRSTAVRITAGGALEGGHTSSTIWDVGTETPLHFDRALGRQAMAAAVVHRTEHRSVVVDLRAPGEKIW